MQREFQKMQLRKSAPYPFNEVRDGTIWLAGCAARAESIQNCFAAYAELNGINMRASRSRYDDSGRYKITFIAGLKKRLRVKI